MIPYGTWINFTLQANPGFSLFSLIVNSTNVGVSSASYYFMPDGNATIYLTSAPIESEPEPTTSPTGSLDGLIVLEPSTEPSAEPTSIVSPLSVIASPDNSPVIVVVLSVLSLLLLIGTLMVYKKKR
jgi:hypothetical protein